jgi:hypothetical protein
MSPYVQMPDLMPQDLMFALLSLLWSHSSPLGRDFILRRLCWKFLIFFLILRGLTIKSLASQKRLSTWTFEQLILWELLKMAQMHFSL